MTRLALVLVIACVVALAGCAGAGTAPPSAAGTPSSTPGESPSRSTAAAPSTSPGPDLATRVRTVLGDFNGTVLIARGGEILLAEGIGMADAAGGIANTLETRFRLGSVTKQFTGMAILLLDADGAIRMADPVCGYVDDCPEAWQDITIEQLVAHTSGIADFTEQSAFDPLATATPAETIASVADLPLQWTPGEFFGYTNTGYVLLGMVIERASGMPYEDFLRERIFGPLEMRDSGYEHGDTPGLAVGYRTGTSPAAPIAMEVPYAAGALYSTVLDLLRWDEALYTDALLPAAQRERFFTPLVDTTDRVRYGYAFGVYAGEDRGHANVSHDGGIDGFRSYLSRYPDDHLLLVLLANREAGPWLEEAGSVIARIVHETP